MSEHLRALVVILGLSLPLLWFARAPACDVALKPAEFNLRAGLWVAITLAAFLAHNFWLYLLLMTGALVAARTVPEDRFPVFLFLLFAVPLVSADVPGFGGVRFIIALNHVRVLTLLLLLPAFFDLRRRPGVAPFGRSWADRAVIGFIAIGLALQWASGDTLTNWLRNGVYRFTDIFLPYYVASRALRDMASFRRALMSFVLAALVLAPIAAFEFVKHWLLYSSLPGALDVRFGFGNYLGRGDSLRALASTGHSIVLGYVMATALALHLFLRRSVRSETLWWAALLLLCVGLVAPIARGPWMGAAASLAVVLLTGPDKMSRTTRFFAIALPLCIGLLVSPYGDSIIDRLPFVGSVDADNVVYRQRLLDVSMGVILMNPWFGAYDFIYNPAMEEMRQGEGIIDIVNSYLAVALSGGLATLACFAGLFAFAWFGVARKLYRARDKTSEEHLLGRALLAALTGVMVTIGTVSSILAIPFVYWCLIGMCVAYAEVVVSVGSAKEASNPSGPLPTFRVPQQVRR
jgi:hypothetical protein